MEASESSSTGDLRAAISNGIVAAMKRLYGKGPERARTYLADEFVFCVLEGGLTTSESTMVEAGEEQLVRMFRLRFQEIVARDLCGVVGEVTGREIINYHSQIVFKPTRSIEIFELDKAPTERRGG